MPDGLTLAELVCTRLCHDFSGPLGAITAAAELLADGTVDPREGAGVVTDAASVLARRLRFLRAAWGAGSEPMTPVDILQLSEGVPGQGRVNVDLSALPDDAPLGPGLARTLLNAILLAGEALPKGGSIRVTANPALGQVLLLPDGPNAAWPPGLAAALGGADVTPDPRSLAAPMTLAVAEAAGLDVSLALAPSGVPLLVIGVRAPSRRAGQPANRA
jgi:histidine phosphotransferase ChpT